jgi:hypothetical protein
MTKLAEPRVPYPTIDQFWRAYQTKERPTDLVAREIPKNDEVRR